MRAWLYDTLYRFGIAPWDFGVRPHLVDLVESERLKVADGQTVLDLGCGTGAEAIWLAERGANVIGVDYSGIALAKAREAADNADLRARCRFLERDITRYPMDGVDGTFDVILDFGALDDLTGQARRDMAGLIHSYARPGTRFVLWCFYARKQDVPRIKFSGVSQMHSMLEPGEEQELFGDAFDIERLDAPQHTACFLMTRR